ncbi:Aste57867_9001 [Aphanomyces stellatus]|uniref:Aste57867_9001 protein n=1 Tax=Aphanomyces stellatus TaxID=120398 RepID=A0A485KLP5_9STRA|nr:hypothetical protein As57867_008966 [Aphanomyces stellatus]VFT85885.1 Aste57867_9001 [Aphanomyces stellatus]
MHHRHAIFSVLISGIAVFAANDTAPWGTVLGITSGVKVYSNDHPPPTDSENYYPDGTDYTNGTYTGLKWQCVELARRYLLVTQGVVFESVDDAAEIFLLRTVKNNTSKERLPLHVFPQGSSTPPQTGSLLLFDRQGAYAPYGHVAVVINVQDSFIDIAEENMDNFAWRPDAYYSRRLRVSYTPSSLTVLPYYNKPNVSEVVLGWATFNPRGHC